MSGPRLPHASPAFRSLGVVLFLWFFTVILAAFAAYVAVSVRVTSRQWRQAVKSSALTSSELIQRATRVGMLRNHKEDVDEVLRTVAASPGVVGVRIYDKKGVIAYSSEPREIGQRVDWSSTECVACHQGKSPPRNLPAGDLVREYQDRDGRRVLGLINPIENARDCSDAGCHAHSPRSTILGVLDVKMSLAETDRRLAAARNLTVTAGMLLALAVGGSSALFVQRFVRRPVQALIAGTERVAQGDLSTRFEVGSRNEMGQLAAAFNRMTHQLAVVQEENDEWARTLEKRVLQETEQRSRAQHQVLHMEKMASLGTLAATVAHELNNPLAGILNYAKLVDRCLSEGAAGAARPEDREEVQRFLRIIQQEASRCGKIVRNFLLFSRQSGGEMLLQPLNPVIEHAVAIVRHHLEMGRVELVWEPLTGDGLGDGQIACDAGQIQQALVDLFVNAVEAMPEGGTLTVRVRPVDGGVELTVADTGVGIAPEALPRIFEPFFTTKEKGSGAGLGLPVVYGIVERHGGHIDVESEEGQGTTFRLTLPRRSSLAEQGVTS
ncbi:MAG TPA: HAMP domain-containing sensor histidine kinase [Thermoanaerobaculia bacterium]|nr:HAMP domain-containing sensor histidine kinase [Thermoanaerobaculia bacterium]